MTFKVGTLLAEAGKMIGTHEAEMLMRHLMEVSRPQLYLKAVEEVPAETAASFAGLVARRVDGEPLQYITGVQSFRGLELRVGPGVLVPRPETEQLVEVALGQISTIAMPKVVDVGTGSGAIALSIASERRDSSVWATEVSPDALHWARINLAQTRLTNVTLVETDLLAGLPDELIGTIDMVVSNPPYLAESQLDDLPADVLAEPQIATIGGSTGMELPMRVVEASADRIRKGGVLVMETWPGQVSELASAMSRWFDDVVVFTDLAGSERIVRGAKR